MKFIKLLLQILILLSVTSLFADDVILPDKEPAPIDLNAIKKDILNNKIETKKENKSIDSAAAINKKKPVEIKKNKKVQKNPDLKSVQRRTAKAVIKKSIKTDNKRSDKLSKKAAAKSLKQVKKPTGTVSKKKTVAKNKTGIKKPEKSAAKEKKKNVILSAEKDSSKKSFSEKSKIADKVKPADHGKDKNKTAKQKNDTDTGKIDILSGKTDGKTEKKDLLSNKKDIVTEKKESSASINSEKSDKDSKKENNVLTAGKSDTVIINPLSSDNTNKRLQFLSFKEISRFSKQKKINVIEDSGPVIDNIAFYTTSYSADFRVDGYDRELNYRLILDLVRYRGSLQPVNSLLKIWGRDVSGRMFLIAELNENNLKDEKIFETLIPYDLSYSGSFDIIVREYSDLPGRWGFWDIIITARRVEQIDIVKPDTSEKMEETELKIFK